jgi:hypothetical protein
MSEAAARSSSDNDDVPVFGTVAGARSEVIQRPAASSLRGDGHQGCVSQTSNLLGKKVARMSVLSEARHERLAHLVWRASDVHSPEAGHP